MPYRAIAVRLSVACRACGGELPVGTIADIVECTACREATPMPWHGLFDVEVRGEVMALGEFLRGIADGMTLSNARASSKVTITGGPARCACGEAFTDQQIGGINRLRPRLVCTKCAAETPARKPPDALVEAYENVVAIIDETPNVALHPHVGVVIRCGECGANLETTGDRTTCPSCGAQNQRPPAAGAIVARPRVLVVFRA